VSFFFVPTHREALRYLSFPLFSTPFYPTLYVKALIGLPLPAPFDPHPIAGDAIGKRLIA